MVSPLLSIWKIAPDFYPNFKNISNLKTHLHEGYAQLSEVKWELVGPYDKLNSEVHGIDTSMRSHNKFDGYRGSIVWRAFETA